MSNAKYDWSDLRKLYEQDRLSAPQIAKMKGCCKSAVHFAARSIKMPLRNRYMAHKLLSERRYNSNTYVFNTSWKGGRSARPNRYVYLKIFPDNPYYCMANKNNYVAEHRLVVAQHIGRPLRREEKVHHVNGIKDDNKIENLQLLSIVDHNIRTSICSKCNLRKEIRMLRWELKQLKEQRHIEWALKDTE